MKPSPALIRRTASAAVVGLLAAGISAALPMSQAFADGKIEGVAPEHVDRGPSVLVSMSTDDHFVQSPNLKVTLTRTGASSDTIQSSSATASNSVNSVTAQFDLTDANPGLYDVAVTGPTSGPGNPSPSSTDSCPGCLTIDLGAPVVSQVQPSTVGADFQYAQFEIDGGNFAKGPYTQCVSLPCPANTATVAVLNGSALDPDVTLDQWTEQDPTHAERMVLTIDAADVGGFRDVMVTNTDGQAGICSSCLHIAPAMSVSGLSPDHLPPGSSGQQIVISGNNFPSDVQVQFFRGTNGPSGDIAWSSMSWNGPTQIILNNVAISSNTPNNSTEDLRLTSPSNHFAHSFPAVFQAGGTSPPPAAAESAATNVTANGGDQKAFIQWTPPPSASSDPITGYVVHTSSATGEPSTPAPGSAHTATVGPLTNGQTYQFYVVVTYQSHQSYTSALSNPTTVSGKPSAPTNVQATAGNRNATVTWTAPAATNGTPVDKYTVTTSPGGVKATVFAQNGQPPPTKAVVSGLKNGTAYTFTVSAHNQGGDSDDSDPSNVVTPIGDPSLSLHAPNAIDKGTSTTLHGQLIDSNGNAVAGASIKLQQRHSGARQFGTLKVLKTSKSGRWSFSVHPVTTTRYRVRWAGDAGDNRVVTGHTVTVREAGHITSPKDGATVPAGTVTVHGRVTSAKGAAVALQQRRGGKWVTIANGTVGSRHRVALQATLAKGTAVLRLEIAGELGTVTGHSPKITVTVS